MSSKIFVGKEDDQGKRLFDPLRNLASKIDIGLGTLEKNLADASTLVPSYEHVPEAAASMNEALKQLRKVEAKTSTLKLSVNDIAEDLEAVRTEALNAFEVIDEDFVRMEKMLEPFGYKPFSASKKVSINIYDCSGSLVETEPSDCNPSLQLSSDTEFDTSVELKDSFEEGVANVTGLDGSYTNVEVTPRVYRKSDKSISQQPSLISCVEETKNDAVPRFSHKKYPSVTTPVNQKGPPCVVPKTESTKPITRPKKVIYSKEVYEILGIEPPPEFYAQQCSN